MSHNLLVNRAASAYLQAPIVVNQVLSGWGTVLIQSPTTNTSGLTISSSVFTATIAGTYLVNLTIYVSSDVSLSWLGIAKNGTSLTRTGTPGQLGWIHDIFEEVELAVGDTFRIIGYSFGGYTIPHAPNLWVVRLS